MSKSTGGGLIPDHANPDFCPAGLWIKVDPEQMRKLLAEAREAKLLPQELAARKLALVLSGCMFPDTHSRKSGCCLLDPP